MAIVVALLLLPAFVVASVPTAGAQPGGNVVASVAVAADAPAGERLPVPQPSTADADKTADDILAKPEYQEPAKSFLADILDRILKWLGDHLGQVGGNMFGSGPASLVTWIIIIALVGLVVFFLVLLVRGLGKRRRAEPDPDDELVFALEERRSIDEWLREAERNEAEGKWKQGLRCRYRSLIGRLIEHQIVRDIPGRTSGEYRVEVRQSAPEVYSPFSDASELFERAWYGDEATGPEESARFRSCVDEIVAGVRRLEHDRDRDRHPDAGDLLEAPA